MEEIYFSDLTTRQRCFKFLRKHWKGIFIIVWPILCSPILLVTDGGKVSQLKQELPILIIKIFQALRCGFLILLMSGFWITECIPSHITSIMPIVFLPALGILSSQITCENYFKDTIIMFMCGIMIALLIEFTHLNMRIAFVAVKLVGPSPRRINFAMMVLTGFISTWISNTAATAMMCPIIKGILSSLGSHGIDIYEAKDVEANVPIKKRRPSKLAIAMYVSTCYAATIGGCGSIIGSPTTIALRDQYDKMFSALEPTESVDFLTYMAYSIPPTWTIMILTYFHMEIFYLGLLNKKSTTSQQIRKYNEDKKYARDSINEKLKELGPMAWKEISVLVLFVFLLFLLLFSSPRVFKGWGDYFDVEVKSSVPISVIVVLAFLLPNTCSFWRFCCGTRVLPTRVSNGLIGWTFLQEHVPWGLIFLVGGGFALADASNVSGLAKDISLQLGMLKVLPRPVILLACIVFVLIATLFTPNVAMINVILPILGDTAITTNCHPLYLMIPSTIAYTLVFHLPVSTPANAIVCSFSNMRTKTLVIFIYLFSFPNFIILYF